MELETILLPIDVTRCPLDIFDLANGFARRSGATLILLHVVNLNILAPENRVYDELEQEAQGYLQRLADQYIHPVVSVTLHVRTGQPADEILAEAKTERVSLILLSTSGPCWWRRLRALYQPAANPVVSPLAEQVIREAECGVFVAMTKTRLNCQRAWGRPLRPRPALTENVRQIASPAPAVSGVNWLRGKAFSQ